MSIAAEAGQKGPGIRSDCWVGLTLRDAGGIEIDLRSRVAALYGDSIRTLVADTLAALGVEHASVEIDDSGALPFVIMARVEAAVRRALAAADREAPPPALPEAVAGARQASRRERFRRSRLYLPGNEPKYMLNAGLHGPDGVILDLEDSVAPSEKDGARIIVRNALRAVDFGSAERMVRINQGELGEQDLAELIEHNVHVVLIPKVESAAQVCAVDERIRQITARSGEPERTVMLMPIIESARGVLAAEQIASACDSVVALTIGLEDYTADLGVQRTAEGRESWWARCMVVHAARAAGVQAIDSVFSDVGDDAALRASVLEAKQLGFEGKGCIHPRQIPIVHEAFAPSAAELDRARRIVAAFEQAQARGLAAVSLGRAMIDPPVVKRALHVVEMAREMGLGD